MNVTSQMTCVIWQISVCHFCRVKPEMKFLTLYKMLSPREVSYFIFGCNTDIFSNYKDQRGDRFVLANSLGPLKEPQVPHHEPGRQDVHNWWQGHFFSFDGQCARIAFLFTH
jgi:hypothetical protein